MQRELERKQAEEDERRR